MLKSIFTGSLFTAKTFQVGWLKPFQYESKGLVINSTYGPRIIRGKSSNHRGIDIKCSQGTTLNCPVNGTLRKIGLNKGGYGLYLEIDFASNGEIFRLILGHLHSFNPALKIDKAVTQGQFLGNTGGASSDKPNCGRSTGPHLHITIKYGSPKFAIDVDPYCFLTSDKMTFKNGWTFEPKNTTGFPVNFSSSWIKVWSDVKNEKPNKYDPQTPDTVETDSTDSPIQDTVDINATEFEEKPAQKTDVNQRLATGIWQIIKLFIDPSAQNKQLMSTDISMQQGSLLSFFNRVCQKPFIEFCSDTYGSLFYFFVRRPPFDKKGFTQGLENYISIHDTFVTNENLNWNENAGYSWYQLLPQAELVGIKEATLFVPAVFFQEYAAIWGSNPLIVTSDYYNYKGSGHWQKDNATKINTDNIIKNAIDDLKYLIESNAYLPFTRQGSIDMTLNRSIKRGTFVKLIRTGEIFYVDSVHHSKDSSGNSNTTINVSRGMIENFITGEKTASGTMVSYFNLIDFGDYNDKDVDVEKWQKVISKFKVNTSTFGFFVKRQQLLTELYIDLSEKKSTVEENVDSSNSATFSIEDTYQGKDSIVVTIEDSYQAPNTFDIPTKSN